MVTDHEMHMEALRLFEENEKLREILRAIDHTLTVHGHIDRHTLLHERITAALSSIPRSNPALCVATAFGGEWCIGKCRDPKDCSASPRVDGR